MREPGRVVLAVFRPTWRQVVGRGLYAGGACAALAVPLVLAVRAAAPVALLMVVAAAFVGAATGRRCGVEVDELGIHRLPPAPSGSIPWKRVVGIRAERRRRRTVVAVYLDSGGTVLLPAPYDGEWLARDPLFERHLFMICHLWETHRDWSVRG